MTKKTQVPSLPIFTPLVLLEGLLIGTSKGFSRDVEIQGSQKAGFCRRAGD
jgi:hypothetical protein